ADLGDVAHADRRTAPRAARSHRVRRTRGARAGAALGDVAAARPGRATDDRRRPERVGRTGGSDAVARLDDVASPRRRPARRAAGREDVRRTRVALAVAALRE